MEELPNDVEAVFRFHPGKEKLSFIIRKGNDTLMTRPVRVDFFYFFVDLI